MKILHTAEYYAPSVGGVQEVVKQVSERLAERGHKVTVATSYHPDREEKIINGVKIEEFQISGDPINGYRGEIERYQNFLVNGDFDLIMNYAAQEWAMDLVFPIIQQIKCRKIMIPCGFSGLYDPDYSDYFSKMPEIMQAYDHLVFHADDYRDTNFAREHNIINFSIIPNGASELEFCGVDQTFRKKYRIPDKVPLLLTVGSHTGFKGHRLCIDSFKCLKLKQAVLVIIGNHFVSPNPWKNNWGSISDAWRNKDYLWAVKILIRSMLGGLALGCLPDDRMRSKWINLRGMRQKRVLLLNPPRADVVSAFHAADLFIFGSNVEYSPLVLYEAAASGTPFISLNCGNAAEIADWTGGGIIAPTIQRDHGYVDGEPEVFANLIAELLNNGEMRKSLANSGRLSWSDSFSWEKIAMKYEALYLSIVKA